MKNSNGVKNFMGSAIAAGLTLILYKVVEPKLLSVLDNELNKKVAMNKKVETLDDELNRVIDEVKRQKKELERQEKELERQDRISDWMCGEIGTAMESE